MKQLKRSDFIESDILDLFKQVRQHRKNIRIQERHIENKLTRIKKLKQEVKK